MSIEETPEPEAIDFEARKRESAELASEKFKAPTATMNFALHWRSTDSKQPDSTEPSVPQFQSDRTSSKEERPSKSGPNRKGIKKTATHVRMQGRGLRSIPQFNIYPNLAVLYLYNNRIDKIQNLEILIHLTHLYLSHNNIRRIENLSTLQRLQKLYITHNKISVLEGFEGLENLRELHMSHQRIPSQDGLVFDPRSIAAIRSSLQILDVSDCGITSIQALTPLTFLRELSVKNNRLESVFDMNATVAELPCLTRLEIVGNPLCRRQRYRDGIAESAPFLRQLDGWDVTSSFRQFLAGREAAVSAVSRRHSLASQQTTADSATGREATLAYSASADAIRKPADVELTEPRAAVSYGNLPPLGTTAVETPPFTRAPRQTPPFTRAPRQPPPFTRAPRRRRDPRQSSGTHVRVGNMLTLTPEQRAAVRTAASQRRLTPDPSSGDFDNLSFVEPTPCPSLPHCPARVPVKAVASTEGVENRQPLNLAPW